MGRAAEGLFFFVFSKIFSEIIEKNGWCFDFSDGMDWKIFFAIGKKFFSKKLFYQKKPP